MPKTSNLTCSYAEALKFIHEGYNAEKVNNGKLNDQTKEFFDAIDPDMKRQFDESPRQIVQLGISTGAYVANLSRAERPVIGYDISGIAINHISKLGIQPRQVDLNEYTVNEEKKILKYQDILSADLSVPVDILIIRTLEHLDEDVLVPLLFALVENMKSNSILYFEAMSDGIPSPIHPDNGKPYYYRVAPGYVPSFFGPRVDFETVSLKRTKNEENDKRSGDNTIVERYLVRKL